MGLFDKIFGKKKRKKEVALKKPEKTVEIKKEEKQPVYSISGFCNTSLQWNGVCIQRDGDCSQGHKTDKKEVC